MPLTSLTCPECGRPVHTDGLIEGEHHLNLACGHEFSDEWLENHTP
jgi:hypothetical protein